MQLGYSWRGRTGEEELVLHLAIDGESPSHLHPIYKIFDSDVQQTRHIKKIMTTLINKG
ncbi:MAG: hypothetical protein GPJ51_09045 [Candidatus Heimdallarchaeota archaeon]|nr:hypothetical protein [Candidatus Heimdallarchaeota archaeon]